MAQEIKLKTPYITLGQLLKIADVISSGGQAKWFLQEYGEDIFVNGENDFRRGRKLYPGDKVEIENVGSFIMKEA
ncbi:S4 domain-containing protein YaaA [Ligilactobacillus equi]|uniref:S4 domain-containing protein YaaA n=2 Tax=Ligilactobacillus equi TaxID=137357 RepID=V7HXC3_9LACO|nr:S4 domain-containing protein YaaA [Ligilactobacillus equi]ETA73930.1 hypothetical protein LEQ_0791c [Ligilactobacillus equi DPC 6820]KRL79339.1 hypothetical protein FC36_GL000774 [Ligilactobacillus equi DSM 15833 = JCM 10991]MCQ2557104.1 S4 domain-containing protein YaaA [Ligilactobacillus sp.]